MPTASFHPVLRSLNQPCGPTGRQSTLIDSLTARFAAVLGFTLAASIFLFASVGFAQEPSAKPKAKLTPEQRAAAKQKQEERKMEAADKRRQSFGILPPNDDSPLGKEYESAYARFRDAVSNLDQIQYRQQLATDRTLANRNEILNEWMQAISQGNSTLQTWLAKAGDVYASDPDKYQQIGEALVEMLLADVELDRFDPWLAPAKALMRAKRFENDMLSSSAGMVGLANLDFDFAEECWAPLNQANKLQGPQLAYYEQLGSLKEKWKREQEIQQRESEKKDNPIVELTTSKGRITVELYEDSAPEAVASFIFLVEKGYYNYKPFFRVEQHVCAQTGCEKGDGTGNAGYRIPGEANRPEHRDHFRGCVSIALGSDKNSGQLDVDSGSAQIFFSFVPMPVLDGKYTVFGRIVEGQPSINLFQVLNLAKEEERKDTSKRPDTIFSAKVVRKRDHEYKPNILAGKLPR